MKIAIIGGGPAGLFAAYRLSEKENNEIVIFEKGKDIDKRKCPVISKTSDKCINCNSCSVMNGIAGAGAFSDGKYNITTEFGGWLQDYIGDTQLLRYEKDADEILTKFGATSCYYSGSDELKKLCLTHGLTMLQSECRHLGTDKNYGVMLNMVDYLKAMPNVNIITNTTVDNCYKNKETDKWFMTGASKNVIGSEFDTVIFAVGRSGSSFFTDWCRHHNVKLENRQVDIGVRVELPSEIWEDFERKVYEPKILYKTKQYGDTVRMFCFNGRGEVVNENTDGIITVNGHAYESQEKKTKNTNFALLSSTNFTEPFNEPIKYAEYVAGLANMISSGSVIVQTLGDLRRGRRTNWDRLDKCTVKPTLKSAIPGDLSLCMPKRQLDNIIEMLDKLNEIAPGTANDDTLLYGIECKFYSAKPNCNYYFELAQHDPDGDATIMTGIYAIGDGAGFTRSLAQACAHGLVVADKINEDM